jgi:hypothetical protein
VATTMENGLLIPLPSSHRCTFGRKSQPNTKPLMVHTHRK